jgi:hypothetical protein
VVTAPRSKRDERKPWRFNSALLRSWKVTGWSRGTVGSGVQGHTCARSNRAPSAHPGEATRLATGAVLKTVRPQGLWVQLPPSPHMRR